MSDREEFQRLQQEADRRKQKEAEDAKKRAEEKERAEAERLATNRAKTEEVRVYCEDTFKGAKVSTGHDIRVRTFDRSDLHRIPSDGVDYVAVYIQHWPDDRPNEVTVPFVLARYYDGNYELVTGLGHKERKPGDFNSFKEELKRTVAGFGQSEITAVLKQLPRNRR